MTRNKNPRPLIGITTMEVASPSGWGASSYTQNRQYTDAVLNAGGVPVLLPYTKTKDELRALYERLDGIMFAGGGDIDPTEYGETDGGLLKDVDAKRDEIELTLMKWSIADDKPFLGICRGLQLLNVALGGTLYQDIPTQFETALNHDLSTEKQDRFYVVHYLSATPQSRLASLIGHQPIDANSHHHQAVKKLAPGLQAAMRAEDGIVEAVELPRSRFAIGVQSHPESLVVIEPRWGRLFKAFIESAANDTYAASASARSSAMTEVLEAV